jgi:nucleotide-binding universal stress UspA family protein
MTRKWLVAFDFSDEAVLALERASEQLSALGDGEVLVVHVHRPLSTGFGVEFASVSPAFQDVDKTITDTARKKLDDVVATMTARFPRLAYRTIIESGYPPDHVAAIASREEVDQIVLGSHGRRGLQRFFLGSVAERVLRISDRPVLVVKHTESTPESH